MRCVFNWRSLFILGLIAIYGIFPHARPDLTQFNADDSADYVGLSYALAHGYGYTRSLIAGVYVPHTTWPPGFPILLMPIGYFTSLPVNWLAYKAYMILSGLIGIGVAWLYISRLVESLFVADIGALLLGLSPFYWLFSRMVMTEVPGIAFVLFALLLIDRAWAQQAPSPWRVAVTGLIAGLGMMIRGTVVGLLLAPIGYFLGERRAHASLNRRLLLLSCHMAAFCVPFIIWNIRNHFIDRARLGKDGISQLHMLLAASIMDPGSRFLTPLEILQHTAKNLAWHIVYHIPDQIFPGLWIASWWTWPQAWLLAIALLLILAVLAFPRSMSVIPMLIVIVTNTGILLIYSDGGSTRYWIPVTCITMVMIAINWSRWLMRLRPCGRIFVLGAVLIAYLPNLAGFSERFERTPYLGDYSDMIALFRKVSRVSDRQISVYAFYPLLFTEETGIASPLTVPGIGLEPSYSNIVLRIPFDVRSRLDDAMPGIKLVSCQGRWCDYSLPKPMTVRELAPIIRWRVPW